MAPTDFPDADAKWLSAARRGDTDAADQLLRRHGARIFRLAMNVTGNREDAEEVVQDACHTALTRLSEFRGDARFSTWLTRIAINHALMVLRKRRPNVVPLADQPETNGSGLPVEIVDWGPNPEQRYGQSELRGILERVAAQLKPEMRIVFQLRDVEELSIAETARMLGLSIAAVKSRLMRARLALREELNRNFRCPPPAQGRFSNQDELETQQRTHT